MSKVALLLAFAAASSSLDTLARLALTQRRRAPKKLPAVGAGECAPAPDALWLVGSFHKTGTVLNQAILADLARRSAGARMQLLGGPTRTGVAAAARAGYRVLFFQNFAIDSTRTWLGDARAYRRHLGLRARAVAWIRDPLSVVLSAYFYHRTAREQLAIGPATSAPVWSFCRASALPFCGAVRNASWGGLASYQALLRSLSADDGALAEAVRSLPTARALNATHAALAPARGARLQDLDAAMASFNATFASIFRWLGVGGPALAACLEAAARHDLARRASNHAFDGSQRHVRDGLRAHLLGDAWFAATYGPLRRAMGYGVT